MCDKQVWHLARFHHSRATSRQVRKVQKRALNGLFVEFVRNHLHAPNFIKCLRLRRCRLSALLVFTTACATYANHPFTAPDLVLIGRPPANAIIPGTKAAPSRAASIPSRFSPKEISCHYPCWNSVESRCDSLIFSDIRASLARTILTACSKQMPTIIDNKKIYF